MSKRVRNNWAFLHLLMDAHSAKQRNSIVNTANAEQVKAIAEIIANTLAGILPLNPAAKKKLSRCKTAFRKISSSTTNAKERKRLVVKNVSYIVKLLSFIKPALKLMTS